MTVTQRRIRTVVRVGLVFAILTAGYVWALSPSLECATEDSTNCYWDATTQGNGQGRSFVDINGTAYYFGG